MTEIDFVLRFRAARISATSSQNDHSDPDRKSMQILVVAQESQHVGDSGSIVNARVPNYFMKLLIDDSIALKRVIIMSEDTILRMA